MWPFGVSEKRAQRIAHRVIKEEGLYHPMTVHKVAVEAADQAVRDHEHKPDNPTCPLCAAKLKQRKTVKVTKHCQSPAEAETALIAACCPPDETLTFACGSERIRQDGKTRFVARCMELAE